MNILCRDQSLLIRAMEDTPEDFNLYLSWMTSPEVMRYWDGMNFHYTYEDVSAHYASCMENQVHPCIVHLSQKPVGYCQFYLTDAEEYEVSPLLFDRYFSAFSRVCGLDLFISEESLRNQGLGSRIIRLMTHYLFSTSQADALVIDPKEHNTRAIRCYEKCGFQKLFIVPSREEQDGIFHNSQIMGLFSKEFPCSLPSLDN